VLSNYGTHFVWLGVLIALVPAFGLFTYLARWKKSMWLSFAAGAVGWTLALVRGPILQVLGDAFLRSWIVSAGAVAATYISIGVSSISAGLFEEGTRYLLVKKIQRIRKDSRHILSMGLGWGLGEAVLIYTVSVISAVYFRGLSLPHTSLLLGALERNIATALHVGLTFMIWKAEADLRYLPVAMGIHFLIDFVGVSLFIVTGNIWATYSVALAIDFMLIVFAFYGGKSFSRERSNP
jgi:uncharacterized membrane protein YhfC